MDIIQLGSDGEIDTTVAASADVFSSDLSMTDGKEFDDWDLLIKVSVATKIKVALDGSDFGDIDDGGSSLTAAKWYRFLFPAKNTDAFQLQATSGTDIGFVGRIRGVKY